MKVPHDTGWHTLINKALSEKPIDKLEETNPELSQYSSISSPTNSLTKKHLWQEKHRLSKPQKRHRFPPSLLSTKAADFWETLIPLRGNCSCSSVSLGVECSRSSFGVSFSNTNVGSSEISVSSFDEVASPETLGETLEYTNQAFELLIARMVRLINILNEGADSSFTRVFSCSNLEILPLLSRESESNADMIVKDIYRRFPSITTSISSNDFTNHYYGSLLPEKIIRRWQSSSKFEIPEQRSRIKSPFSSVLPYRNSFEISESVLTEEELIYFLRNKRSLISEYFQCKVESKDLLKKKPDPFERKGLIYVTQSDSRLQEHSLVRFVQFIKTRRKKEAEDVLKENTPVNENLESKTGKYLIPKRRVTFSNPLAVNSTNFLNCSLIEDEDDVLSVQSFTTAFTHDVKNSCDDYPESGILIESKSSSDLDSSVSLKPCIANLSLNSLSTEADDSEIQTVHSINSLKSIEDKKVLENEIGENYHSCCDIPDIKMSREESGIKMDVVSVIPDRKARSFVTEDCLIRSLRSTPPNSSTLRRSVEKDVELIKKNKSRCSKFFTQESLDRGTTHVPMSEGVEEDETRKADDRIRRVTFEECSQQQNSEERLEKINTYQVLVSAGNCSSIADGNCTWNRELENESIVNETNEIGERLTRSYSDELEISKPEYTCHSFTSSDKTVTFQNYYQTISDRSITRCEEEELLEPSSRSDDRWIYSSVDTGPCEVTWKGCWDQKNKNDLIYEQSQDKKQTLDSEETEIMPNIAEFTVVERQSEESEEVSWHQEPLTTLCSRKTTYSTTVKNETELANDCGLEYESNVFTADKNGSEADKTKEDISNFYYDFESNPKVIDLPNCDNLARGLGDVCKRIRNPEIWRSEIQTLAKPNWYTTCNCDRYSCKKKSEGRSDWLMRRLEELQSSPDADYESDYYADSEVESDFEWAKDFSLVKRSLSDIDVRSECRRKYKTLKKDRRKKNLFLDNVWSGKKVFFRGCRCHNNPPSTRYDLKPRERDLRHRSFQDSDERLKKNFFSNLRAKIISDSETDDSDFSLSIQPEFRREFNCRDEHVNKIKCRRFVKSLKSVGSGVERLSKSNYDRQFSSLGLLHVAFQRSFSPVSVQTEISTRTVATNVFEEQNDCSVMDVCIDTNDLCPRKSIGTINRATDSILESKDGSCQTLESFLDSLNSVHSGKSSSERFSLPIQKKIPSVSNSQEYKRSGQKLSNAIASLSAQINNASDNLAKSRFSEVETTSESIAVSPAIKQDNFSTAECSASCEKSFQEAERSAPSTSQILFAISPNNKSIESPSGNILNDSSSYVSESSNCPICNSGKKSAARYVLPACFVKGAFPDRRINEKKDPWNRVMERAKIQHRYEGRNGSSSLKFHQTYYEQSPFSSEEPRSQGESKSVHHPRRVKDNSARANRDQDKSGSLSKISSPPPIESQRRLFPLPVCSLTPFDSLFPNLRRTQSPKRTRKEKAIESMSNRFLYIISEKAELIHRTSIKVPASTNFFTRIT